MGIKFKLKPEGIWIRGDNEFFNDSELGEYTIEDRKSVKFFINPLTTEILEEFREKNTRKSSDFIWVSGRRERKQEDRVDEKSLNDDILNYVLGDWEGIMDENNKPIPCDRENKLAVVKRGYPRLGGCFIDVGTKVMSQFDELQREKEEKIIKNFGTSQVGTKED